MSDRVNMTMDGYARMSSETAEFGGPIANMVRTSTDTNEGIGRLCRFGELSYVSLGLVGEAGEIANKVKKVLRDRGGVIDPDTRETLLGECGDVLWYLSQMVLALGGSLDDVAVANLEKLRDRAARGVIGGSGDCR